MHTLVSFSSMVAIVGSLFIIISAVSVIAPPPPPSSSLPPVISPELSPASPASASTSDFSAGKINGGANVNYNSKTDSISVGNTLTNNIRVNTNNIAPQVNVVMKPEYNLGKRIKSGKSGKSGKSLRQSRLPTEDEVEIKKRFVELYEKAKSSDRNSSIFLKHLGRAIEALNPKYIATQKVKNVVFSDPIEYEAEHGSLPETGNNELENDPDQETPKTPEELNQELTLKVKDDIDELIRQFANVTTFTPEFLKNLNEADSNEFEPTQIIFKKLVECIIKSGNCKLDDIHPELLRKDSDDLEKNKTLENLENLENDEHDGNFDHVNGEDNGDYLVDNSIRHESEYNPQEQYRDNEHYEENYDDYNNDDDYYNHDDVDVNYDDNDEIHGYNDEIHGYNDEIHGDFNEPDYPEQDYRHEQREPEQPLQYHKSMQSGNMVDGYRNDLRDIYGQSKHLRRHGPGINPQPEVSQYPEDYVSVVDENEYVMEQAPPQQVPKRPVVSDTIQQQQQPMRRGFSPRQKSFEDPMYKLPSQQSVARYHEPSVQSVRQSVSPRYPPVRSGPQGPIKQQQQGLNEPETNYSRRSPSVPIKLIPRSQPQPQPQTIQQTRPQLPPRNFRRTQ